MRQPVLLVEDDHLISDAIKLLLELTTDLDLTVVSTAAEARAVVGSRWWLCLLLDLRLPDTDGITLLEQLRAGGLTAPALVLSAQYTTESFQRARSLQVARWLPKPVASDDLLAALSAISTQPAAAVAS